MSLEPLAGVFVSMARSEKTIIHQSPQVAVARTEPGSKSFDTNRCLVAKLKLPHGVRNSAFASVKSLDVATKLAVEIKTDLSGRDAVHLSVVVYADVSD